MVKLDVYKVIEGTDDWPLIATLEAETDAEVLDLAEENYGSNNAHHWTNPY